MLLVISGLIKIIKSFVDFFKDSVYSFFVVKIIWELSIFVYILFCGISSQVVTSPLLINWYVHIIELELFWESKYFFPPVTFFSIFGKLLIAPLLFKLIALFKLGNKVVSLL